MIGFLLFLLGFFKILFVMFICIGVPLAGLAWLLIKVCFGDAKMSLYPIIKLLEKK